MYIKPKISSILKVRQGKLNGTLEDELISPFGECPLTLSCFGKKETTKKEEKP